MKRFSLLLIILPLAACGARGVQIDPDQVSNFKVGVTRYEEVLSALGKPSSRTVDSQGDIHLHYTHSFYSMKPESFIPIVGGHIGGMDNSSKSIVVSFNSDGVMKNSNFSKIKTDAVGAY